MKSVLISLVLLSTINLHAEVFSLKEYKKTFKVNEVAARCMNSASEYAEAFGLLENTEVKLWGINTDKVTEIYDIKSDTDHICIELSESTLDCGTEEVNFQCCDSNESF